MEFLFENPFLLVILIGIISSLFNRMKGKEEEQRKPKPKPFMENGPIEQPRTEPPIRKERTSERTSQPRTESPTRMEKRPERSAYDPNPLGKIEQEFLEKKRKAEEKITALKQQQAIPRRREESVRTQGRLNQLRVVEDEPKKKSITVDEQKLVDAIVWSEILGPPRSKRSHAANRIGR